MTIQPDPNANTWHNDTGKAIYRTADDRIVDQDDPDAAFLVCGVDGTIPMDIAEKYGLTGEKAKAAADKVKAAAEKAKADAPANKAKTTEEKPPA